MNATTYPAQLDWLNPAQLVALYWIAKETGTLIAATPDEIEFALRCNVGDEEARRMLALAEPTVFEG